jgi:type I restriction enzyme S subunit
LTLDRWGAAAELGSRKGVFSSGDLLFGKIRPYFHKVSVAPVDGICSTDAIIVRPDDDFWGLAVLTMFSDEFVTNAVQTSSGTKMPRADWKVIGQFPVAVPPVDLARRFTEIARHMLATAQRLMLGARSLADIRDLLLPALITGRVDVSHLDLDAAEALVA